MNLYQESLASQIIHRTRWYIFLRFFFLLGIAIPAIASLYFTKGWIPEVQRNAALAVAAVGSNVIFYFLGHLKVKNLSYYKFIAVTLLILDVIVVSALIFINGGIESRSPILYTIPILMAAAIFGRRATYIAAISCSTVYSGIIIADYLGIVHSIGAMDPTLRSDLPYVINSIVFFPIILLVISLAVDFITRQLIEKQRQANQNLEALMRAQEIAKLGSWEWDIKDDSIKWSQELFRIFGVTENQDKLAYDTYLKTVHPEDVEHVNKKIMTALKKKTVFNVDHRIVMPDGFIKHIHSEGRPLLDSKGRAAKLIGTAQDVTEARQLEVVKREFVSLASHQLRTPASGVKAYLSLLAEGYAGELNDDQMKFLRQAYESNNRQLEIIEKLLSLAAIESGKIIAKKELIDLNALVSMCLPHHSQKAREQNLKLAANISKSRIAVNADPIHLQMAIDNLISNAIKYSLERGKISISTNVLKESAYVEVKDQGIGIAKENIPDLFKKFSRIEDPASKTVSGSGLGLYLAKYVAQLNRGTITVQSSPNAGSVFRLRIPLSKRKAVK